MTSPYSEEVSNWMVRSAVTDAAIIVDLASHPGGAAMKFILMENWDFARVAGALVALATIVRVGDISSLLEAIDRANENAALREEE